MTFFTNGMKWNGMESDAEPEWNRMRNRNGIDTESGIGCGGAPV